MAARDTAEVTLRARCVELSHAVMDVTRADGATAFMPSLDSRVLAFVAGLARNRAAERYASGLLGISVDAVPVLRLLAEGHAAVLHREDDLPLLPGQREVLMLLGIETLSLVPSNPVSGWRYGVTFSHDAILDVEVETLVTVQKILDRSAPDIRRLIAELG